MASIWPETYSYTTHEMLATGLPVVSFSLGAQGDTVASHRNGIIVENDIAIIHSALSRAAKHGMELIECNSKKSAKAE